MDGGQEGNDAHGVADGVLRNLFRRRRRAPSFSSLNPSIPQSLNRSIPPSLFDGKPELLRQESWTG